VKISRRGEMGLHSATDNILDLRNIALLCPLGFTGASDRRHGRAMSSPTSSVGRRSNLRWLLLVVLAALCAAILLGSWIHAGSVPHPRFAARRALARPVAPETGAALRRADQPVNPAMQKAGAPDPVAQKTAAASAEAAARAAADLAGSSSSK
jgi:hypothetical protein